jgi:hypothetical protein
MVIMAAIALVIAAMVWLTLYEIKLIAENNAPTAAETAECIAALEPGADPAVECPTGADVIWAARNPLRNAAIVLVLCLVAGYIALRLNRRLR